MFRTPALRLLALVLAVMNCPGANAAYVCSATSSEGKEVLFLDGEIRAGDAQQFEASP